MTYVKAPKRGDTDPGIHVLLIGVSDYFHLPGGRPRNQFAHGSSFQPLDAPDFSCKAIGEWLVKGGLVHPTLPIKSIEMLGSSISMQGVKLDVPTFANVNAAINRWVVLGDAVQENLLLFYFCGHGIQRGVGSHSLLCADFGAHSNNPFAHAIDYENFERGMRACGARQQVFLLDACRSAVPDVTENFFGAGDPIVTRRPPQDMTEVSQAVIWATSSGSEAWARGRKKSIFAEAFIKAFEGGAAQKDMLSPMIFADPDSLKKAMVAWITANGEVAQEPQFTQPVGQRFPLHEFADVSVPVFVRCWPTHETINAQLSCWQDSVSLRQGRAKQPQNFWRIDLPEGEYTFKAKLDGIVSEERGLVYPPLHPVFIKV